MVLPEYEGLELCSRMHQPTQLARDHMAHDEREVTVLDTSS